MTTAEVLAELDKLKPRSKMEMASLVAYFSAIMAIAETEGSSEECKSLEKYIEILAWCMGDKSGDGVQRMLEDTGFALRKVQ